MKVKELREGFAPVRKSAGAAAYDLRTTQAIGIREGETIKVATGISVAIPCGHVGVIRGRSGLAADYQIDVLGGVIDEDYRGEIFVLLRRPPSQWMIERWATMMIRTAGSAMLRWAGVTGGLIPDPSYDRTTRAECPPGQHDIVWFKEGDRIAQLLVIPCYQEEVEVVDELSDTERGSSGFGSTGK